MVPYGLLVTDLGISLFLGVDIKYEWQVTFTLSSLSLILCDDIQCKTVEVSKNFFIRLHDRNFLLLEMALTNSYRFLYTL